MERKPREYLAYLLRLWRADGRAPSGQATNWRASLESPQSGERVGFGSLAELFAFLTEEVLRCEGEREPSFPDDSP
ncbi:MAG: hypothetical protein DYG89_28895 [Caldilinea sp. CFX5]|nr:hypothetical protein [Caldilinea sp. CFX5]